MKNISDRPHFAQDLVANEHKAALAVFGRVPRLGQVKTRLAEELGATAALRIYEAMLRDVLSGATSTASSLQSPIRTVLFYATAGEEPVDIAPEELRRYWDGPQQPQATGDLGARLFACFAQLQEFGAKKIVITGSDAPDLPESFITQAFAVLDHTDLVLGPSRDGGFYLIGASCSASPSWFESVAWSSDTTLQDVLSNLGQRTYALLPRWDDVDTAADLQALWQRLKAGQSGAPQTHQTLRDLGYK